MSAALTSERRATLHRRVRFIVGFTITYNVIEAAVKLGVRKIVVASSETTYGVCFSDGQTDPASLPLEEDYDVDPMDSYGLSKVLNEVTAGSARGPRPGRPSRRPASTPTTSWPRNRSGKRSPPPRSSSRTGRGWDRT